MFGGDKAASERPRISVAVDYRQTQMWALLVIMALVMIAIGAALAHVNLGVSWLIWFFFVRQDAPLIILVMAILMLRPEIAERDSVARWPAYLANSAAVYLLAIFLIGVCWAGHYLILMGHDLVRDEEMANFDASIFAHGKLFWEIPKFWRPFAGALNQRFILPIGNHEAWVSTYLPVNAAIRVLVGMISDRALTSPSFVGIGLIALWRITLRLWPDSPSTRGVVLLLYAGSSQVLITGMTAFAMTGHLALDLVWLALFLYDRKLSHVSAVAVGFLATGLHQPLFHPMFVLPFMGLLVARRRWPLLAFYGVSYALIGSFWFFWPIWISSHGVGPIIESGSHGVSYLTRLLSIIKLPDARAWWLMSLNLLRFATWQHLLLLPLMAFGIRFCWQKDALARALAISFVFPIPVMLILLPDQGHGWGYRYLHGVIGNACLLGGYGWYALKTEHLLLRRTFALANALTFLLLIPIRAYMAHQMLLPFAQLDSMIAHSRSDMVILDTQVFFSRNLVINQADLSNRPIRLDAARLQRSDISTLCNRGAVAFLGADGLRPISDYFGLSPQPASNHIKALEQVARDARCDIQPLKTRPLLPQ